MKSPIQIVFAFDQNYVMPCGVAMLSICMNTPGPICFHVVADKDVTEESKATIAGIAESYGNQALFYTSDSVRFGNLPDNTHITRSTYSRLLLPELLPAQLDKVLYLDVDIITPGSLEPLWEMELDGDVPAAMAVDRLSFDKVLLSASVVPESRYYYNAGVMLINLDCWRREKLGEQCVRAIEEFRYKWMDQDAVNVIFGERVSALHLRYNMQNSLRTRPMGEHEAKEFEPQVREAIESPVIIHYSESFKPWHQEYGMPEEWLEYKAMSPWKDTPLSRYTVKGDYPVNLNGFKELDVLHVESIALPLLTITSQFATRHPHAFKYLRKALWAIARRRYLVK